MHYEMELVSLSSNRAEKNTKGY